MTEATMPTPLGLAFRSLLTADSQTIVRSRLTLIFNLAVPIVILLITSRGTRFGNSNLVIALALTLGLLSSALMGYSVSVARDRDAGVFQRLRVAPVPTWAIMVSRLTVQFAAAVVTVFIVIVVGSVIRRTAYPAGTYVLIFLVALYGAAMFLAISQAIVGLIRSAIVVNAVGRIVYVVLLLTGLLGSSGVLGRTVEDVTRWTPVGALITLFTAAQNRTPWSGTDLGAVLVSAGYLLIFAGIGIRWFRWDADA